MASEVQDSRGRAQILAASIYSRISGVSVDVMDSLMSVVIHEDIYTPYITCDVTFIDYDKVAKKFPLAGEEYFYVKFKSYRGREIDFTFLLYKNSNVGSTPLDTVRGMVLHGVTTELAFDKAKVVQQSFYGTYSSIASDIFDRYVKNDASGLDMNYEPSRGVFKVVSPFWTALQAIDYCRARAVASSEVKSPFVFFRNVDGYHFRSLNGLFNEMASMPEAAKTHVYASRPLSAAFDENEVAGYVVDIVDYHIPTYYDTMEKIALGAYNSDSYSFDLLTKSFILNKRFNLSERGGNFQLGGAGGVYNRQQFVQAFNNTRCAVSYVATNVAREFDGASKDFFPEFVGEKSAYTNLVGEYNFRCTVYGNTDMTAGQVMRVAVPPIGRDKAGEETTTDPMFSGSFLIANIEHVITFNTNIDYYMVVSGINGARDYTVEGMNQ